MKRSYIITKINREKRPLKYSDALLKFFEDNKPEDMTFEEYHTIFMKKNWGVSNFVKYHHFDEKVKDMMTEELKKTLPVDIKNFSSSKTYILEIKSKI